MQTPENRTAENEKNLPTDFSYYPFYLWIGTLIIAPIFILGLSFIKIGRINFPDQVLFFLLAIVIGALFASPTFLFMSFVHYISRHANLSPFVVRLLTLFVLLLGTISTFYILSHTFLDSMAILYSVIAVLVFVLLQVNAYRKSLE